MLLQTIPTSLTITQAQANTWYRLPHPYIVRDSIVFNPVLSEQDFSFDRNYQAIKFVNSGDYTFDYSYKGIKKDDLISELRNLFPNTDFDMTGISLGDAIDVALIDWSLDHRVQVPFYFYTAVGVTEYVLPLGFKCVKVHTLANELVDFETDSMAIYLSNVTRVELLKAKCWVDIAPNDQDVITYLDDVGAKIILKKAQSLVLLNMANKAAQDAWKFTLADQSVDKTGLAGSFRNQALAIENEYKQLSQKFTGLVMYVV